MTFDLGEDQADDTLHSAIVFSDRFSDLSLTPPTIDHLNGCEIDDVVDDVAVDGDAAKEEEKKRKRR